MFLNFKRKQENKHSARSTKMFKPRGAGDNVCRRKSKAILKWYIAAVWLLKYLF